MPEKLEFIFANIFVTVPGNKFLVWCSRESTEYICDLSVSEKWVQRRWVSFRLMPQHVLKVIVKNFQKVVHPNSLKQIHCATEQVEHYTIRGHIQAVVFANGTPGRMQHRAYRA